MKNVLMISTDGNIFDEKSAVRSRHRDYAKEYSEMHVIVFTKNKEEAKQDGNLFLYPTNSLSKWLYVFDAIKIGKNILSENYPPRVDEVSLRVEAGKLQTTNWLLTVQDPFLTSIVGVRLKNKFNIPLEIQIHTDIGSPYYYQENFLNKIRLYIARWSLRKADKIRVMAERIKSFLINDSRFKIQASRIGVSPIHIDIEKIKNTPITVDLCKKYSQFNKIILMACRLTKEKDIKTAIETFKGVVEKLPNTGLIIVGSGPELSFLKFHVSCFKLYDSVIFEDWVNQETLFSYYKTADILLSTSLYEGYGMSMAEAHTAGCQVVATDAGISGDITTHICRVGNSECLTFKLVELLKK